MEDQILHTTLVTTLISSTVDGFAALGDIPIQSVLKYLKRCMDIKLLSKVCHSHVGKALAENLFRAAIEAKDRSALKCMLDFPCIDINSIVCIVDGQKYTPIGRAVSLQDLGMVKMFLDGRAEVNKTCDLDASPGGILGLLLNTTRRNDRISSEFIEIVKLLLRAGAKLHLDIVRRALHDYNIPDLAFDLVSSVQETDHSNLIRDDFLSHIAVYLDDGQATQATKNIIMACERTQCHKCRTDYQEELDWALIQGAKRGHLQLLLNQGGRFEPAITAASKIGNMVHVRKLLKSYPSPTPSHMSRALLYAVEEGYEGVFQALLAAGADVNRPSSYDPVTPNALFAALLRRNLGMVRAILSADVMEGLFQEIRYKGRDSSIFREALRWGNDMIVHDLLSALPSGTLGYGDLSLVLDAGRTALFRSLLKRGAVSVFALTGCLEIGLSRGDTKLIQELVEMGADPLDLQIFTKCLDEYPNMLLSLCKHVSFRKSHHVVPRFGTDALYLAVARGQAGLAAVTFLLGTGLIDAKSFPTHTAIQLLPHSTPLGQAIYVSRNGQHSNFEVIRELLDYGCDPNSTVTRPAYPTDSRKTALLEAINTRSADLVKLLIDRGARVNEEAKLGLKRTPLQKAVEVESLEIVTLLLEQKAEVNARPADRGGATAFQLAAIRGNCIIAAKLLEKGADLFAPPAQINGRWPLEGAAENGRFQMINFLWLQNRGCFDPEVCRRAMELAKGNGFMACRDAIEDFLRERERVADFLAFT
ncbi:ankyrin repeat-containing domain protein [Rhexocercosporidium sp. MPI-PUGE-AT-0058]|nr:ankyrin repeat-containing domain protein [Rhexocercosporidium sp. MPI-PUGE-AT-0058]